MGKITCFSSLALNPHDRTAQDDQADQESLTLEDDVDLAEQDADVENGCSYTNVQDLTDVDQLDDDDDDDEDDGGFQVVVSLKSRLWSLRAVLVSGHGLICVYVGLVILLVGSTVSLVVVCIHVIKPYVMVSGFTETECYTVGLTKQGNRGCMCGIGCNNRYSCVLVTVTYPTPHNQTWLNVTMYEDESIIQSQCSFFPPCRSSQSRIDSFLRDYVHEYGPVGKRLQCYHSLSNDIDYVIRTRRFHRYHVIHGLFWTNIGLMSSLIGLLYTYKRKKCTIV